MNILGVEVPLAAVAGFISAMIAAIAALLVWLQWRERRLRQDDVLRWSNEVIRAQQTLYLVLFLGDSAFDRGTSRTMLAKIAVDTSVLVEQGRLFFKNTPDPTYGADRHPALSRLPPDAARSDRGGAPDCLPVGGGGRGGAGKNGGVAEDCVRSFVSMAQLEVGRSKTAHEDTARRGEGEKLETLLGKVKPERLEALRRNARLSL